MKTLSGRDKIRDALSRLDQLTKDEGLSAVAQTLGVVHGISKVVMGGVPYFYDFLTDIYLNTCSIRWKRTDGWYRTKFGYVSLAKQV